MRRTKHKLHHYQLLTGDMGLLYPTACVEVLPGDTFQHAASALVRLSPMVAPVMHGMQLRVHHWFVPNRLVWPEWEEFITGDENPTFPELNAPGTDGTILDYMAVPPDYDGPVSAIPVRAYNLIWNEFYRDEDLQEERDAEDLSIPRVAWAKDYYTTARPWPQKGEAVTIPLGSEAPVRGLAYDSSQSTGTIYDALTGEQAQTNEYSPGHIKVDGETPPYVIADLSAATGIDVRDLRLSLAIQRFQEARARYGSRYTEYLRYLGVRSPDARLQRPEYLGGAKAQINVSEVLQTAPDQDPQGDYGVGDMFGHGIAPMRSRPYRRFFPEHGYVISVLSVRPKSIYTDGLHRHWNRRTKLEFWQKELELIGQQEVANREVYAVHSDPDGTFGYSDRYREYREHPSSVAGEFRDVLNYWHLARKFESEPALNESFIQCDPSKRIFNEQTRHSLWMAVNHRIVARRLVGPARMARVI